MKKISPLRMPLTFLAILAASGALLMCAFLPTSASAASVQAARCAADDLQCVIKAGDLLISNRLADLNILKTRVSNYLSEKRLTDAQASELQNDVSSNESGLQSLKTKLDAETVAKEARKDVANIYTQFRIYAVVLPRDRRHIVLDIEVNTRDKMVSAETNIQNAINQAPSDQKDQLNTLFNDYKQRISDADLQFQTANQTLPQLTPASFNQNRAAYEATRRSLDLALRTARIDLGQAAKDLSQMVKIIGHDI